jgi:hypothetical protein
LFEGVDTGRIKQRWQAALGLHSGDKGGCGFSAFLPIATALAFHGQGLSRHRSHDHLIDLIAGQNAALNNRIHQSRYDPEVSS